MVTLGDQMDLWLANGGLSTVTYYVVGFIAAVAIFVLFLRLVRSGVATL